MSQDSPRIAELRRRVHADPASIAFAQLAEEYRRAGHYHEAVKYCRAGLARHPGYLSARVTLGRALVELGELDDAAIEFDLVLRSAPDNLAAIRSVAEIHQRRGSMEAALDYYTRALALARFDPELEESVNRLAREIGRVGSAVPEGLSFEEASSEFLTAAAQGAAPSTAADPAIEPLIDFDALLASLGLPDAAPPPVTERLIAEPASATAPARPLLPEPPFDTVTGDPFATLEHELRAFGERSTDAGRAADGPNESVADDRSEAFVVEELEAWLRVLRNDDSARSPSV